MPRIILNDGTEFNCNFCGVSSSGVLYLDLTGISMAQAVSLFGDGEKVSKITYRTYQEDNNAEDTEYNNFSVLIGVQYVQNLNGTTRVSMRRPYVGE